MWPPSSGTAAVTAAQRSAIWTKPWSIRRSEPLAAQQRVDQIDADQRGHDHAQQVRGAHTRSSPSMRSASRAKTPTASAMAMTSMEAACAMARDGRVRIAAPAVKKTSRSGQEAVADAGIGANQPRTVGRLDLSPQVGDVGAQRRRVAGVALAPDLREQGAVGQQPPAVAHERAQQVELDRREVYLVAVTAHGPRREVDVQAVGLD